MSRQTHLRAKKVSRSTLRKVDRLVMVIRRERHALRWTAVKARGYAR